MRRRGAIPLASKKAAVCLAIFGLPFAGGTVGLIAGAVHFFRTGALLHASMFTLGAVIFGALSTALFVLAVGCWKTWRREQAAPSK